MTPPRLTVAPLLTNALIVHNHQEGEVSLLFTFEGHTFWFECRHVPPPCYKAGVDSSSASGSTGSGFGFGSITSEQTGLFLFLLLLVFIVIVAHVKREQIQGFTDCRLLSMHLDCFSVFMLLCNIHCHVTSGAPAPRSLKRVYCLRESLYSFYINLLPSAGTIITAIFCG